MAVDGDTSLELDLFLDDDGQRPIGPPDVGEPFFISNEERLAWFARRVFKYDDELDRVKATYENRRAKLEGERNKFLSQFGGQAEQYLMLTASTFKGKMYRDTEWGRVQLRKYKHSFKVTNTEKVLDWFRRMNPGAIKKEVVETVPKEDIGKYVLQMTVDDSTGEEIPRWSVPGAEYVPERTSLVLMDIPGYRGKGPIGPEDAEADS